MRVITTDETGGHNLAAGKEISGVSYTLKFNCEMKNLCASCFRIALADIIINPMKI